MPMSSTPRNFVLTKLKITIMNNITRKVEKIIAPPSPHYVGDGFRVHNFIPSQPPLTMQRMSPFIMLDYNAKFEFAPSKRPKGVGVHPHRGFETVTIAYEGAVSHGDSAGHKGTIYKGDVQWMTAASGVLHKEYHEENFSKTGGLFQMVQLWINLPAKDKMSPPKYQDLLHKDIPKITIDEKGSLLEIIAGNFEGTSGAAETFTPLQIWNIKLKKDTKFRFTTNETYNTALLQIEGSSILNNDQHLDLDHLALMENKGNEIEILAKEDSIILLMSGQPIDEPIAAHGPFVMNTHQEILEAFQDYNLGKFGYLEDEDFIN